ncbi:MAG: hypothetical protein K2K37_01975, partial [Muribaculaceae bacterium]|nr:hypothetical protein [Muribaculaceae bacterium]
KVMVGNATSMICIYVSVGLCSIASLYHTCSCVSFRVWMSSRVFESIHNYIGDIVSIDTFIRPIFNFKASN